MLNYELLKVLLNDNGYPTFRAKQIYYGVYKELKTDFFDIMNLPLNLKEFLLKRLDILSFTSINHIKSSDSSIKTLFQLKDGKNIESVLMQFDDGRCTVCVSSQVGCALKCKFCATGTMGFSRNLSAEEITDQVLFFDQILAKEGKKVTHVVYMGMGEPFLNFDEVKKSLYWLNDSLAFGLGARHITISTAGIVDRIKEFSDIPLQMNLAVSLHAPNQELREKIMPIAKQFSLDELMEEVKEYMNKTHRRVSYEYVMLKDVNDSLECAHQLAKLLKGQLCHVNLIRYNATYSSFAGSSMKRIREFEEIVKSYGIPISLRISRGGDIDAACGQLSLKKHATGMFVQKN
jgi:23S rRNA (adenine2503-C2)-methyltransferase